MPTGLEPESIKIEVLYGTWNHNDLRSAIPLIGVASETGATFLPLFSGSPLIVGGTGCDVDGFCCSILFLLRSSAVFRQRWIFTWFSGYVRQHWPSKSSTRSSSLGDACPSLLSPKNSVADGGGAGVEPGGRNVGRDGTAKENISVLKGPHYFGSARSSKAKVQRSQCGYWIGDSE